MKGTKEKAESIVNEYRVLLMNEDTDCGNEILCTTIAIKFALILCDEVLNNIEVPDENYPFWVEVKEHIK